MRNNLYTFHRIVETTRRSYILDDGVFKFGLVLRENGDPLFGLGVRATGAADGVACFEVG